LVTKSIFVAPRRAENLYRARRRFVEMGTEKTTQKFLPLSTRPEAIFLEATESPAAAAERYLRVMRTSDTNKPSDPNQECCTTSSIAVPGSE
jgi:hypothetical protein